jgi:hypothetical protein
MMADQSRDALFILKQRRVKMQSARVMNKSSLVAAHARACKRALLFQQAQRRNSSEQNSAEREDDNSNERESERKCGTCTMQLNTTEQKRSVPATNLNLRRSQ